MRFVFKLIVASWVAACGLDQGSTSQPAVPPTAASGARPTEGPQEPGVQDDVVEPIGEECKSNSDCYPQTDHATWCAPTKPEVPIDVVESVVVVGTLDPPWWKASPPGCRCVNGRCGALLNDGRLVIGRQPPSRTVAPPHPLP
jgi:hypothetical protein